MKIGSICGSLRLNSTNHCLLKLAQKYLNQHEWINFDLSKLPFFDPENQYGEMTPEIVLNLRRELGMCDLIFIATPEYAHGIPGMLKNGFEWLFCELTMNKKVAIVIGAVQGQWARDQLIEVLSTMDFNIDLKRTMIINGANSKIDTSGTIVDPKLKLSYEQFLDSLI